MKFICLLLAIFLTIVSVSAKEPEEDVVLNRFMLSLETTVVQPEQLRAVAKLVKNKDENGKVNVSFIEIVNGKPVLDDKKKPVRKAYPVEYGVKDLVPKKAD